uniref:Cation efflux protein cytoplasmic domain-containing protein n=1 Tax=Amphora coffeiformis TaxID=265554 RepID=A0A7S3L0K7_9STRA
MPTTGAVAGAVTVADVPPAVGLTSGLVQRRTARSFSFQASDDSNDNNNSGNGNPNSSQNASSASSPDVLTWQKVEPQLYQRKHKRIRRFYKAQNLLIDRLQTFYRSFPLSLASSEAVPLTDDEAVHANANAGDNEPTTNNNIHNHNQTQPTAVGMALYASFALNVLLLIVKIMASVLSGSMSVIASAADSLLDLVSGTVLVVTHRLMNKSDQFRYPQGKTRMEPVGVFAFAIIMLLSSLQIMIEAIRRLFDNPDIDMGPLTLTILGFTIISKAFMAWYCRRVADVYQSSAAEAYADDHRNDVLTNAVGVGAALAAYYVPSKLWFLDSTGAICIAIYIIVNWLQTGREQLHFLTGRGASPMLLQELTYIAAHHDERIKYVDTVRAYHFGVHYLVEVDIVLPEDMTLRESHDIGESLQHRLEQLEDVERAFVHNDYEWDHSPVVFQGTRIIRK